jgi:hypothetical protein
VVFTKGDFLKHLLHANGVAAPAALARRRSFERGGLMPPDLPLTGDWYLWSIFALSGDVAYIAEPMVNYRVPELALAKTALPDPARVVAEGIDLRWRIRRAMEAKRARRLVDECKRCMGYHYGSLLAQRGLRGDPIGLDVDAFEASLRTYGRGRRERAAVRALSFAAAADEHYDAADVPGARRYYARALRAGPLAIRTWMKYILLRIGRVGPRVPDGRANNRERGPATASAS